MKKKKKNESIRKLGKIEKKRLKRKDGKDGEGCDLATDCFLMHSDTSAYYWACRAGRLSFILPFWMTLSNHSFFFYFLPDNPLISLIYLFSILYCIHYNSHLPNASCAWSIKCKCLNRWWSRKSSRLQTSSGFPRLTQDQPSSQRPRLCHSRIRMHQSITNI